MFVLKKWCFLSCNYPTSLDGDKLVNFVCKSLDLLEKWASQLSLFGSVSSEFRGSFPRRKFASCRWVAWVHATLISSILLHFFLKKTYYYSVMKIAPLLMPSMVKLLHGETIKLGPPQSSCSTTSVRSCCFMTPFSVLCYCLITLKYNRPMNFVEK